VAFWLRPSGYGTWGSFSTLWDVVIDPLTSGENETRVSTFIEDLVGVIGDADRAGLLRDYCLGLLLPGERKRIEPLAVVTARACRWHIGSVRRSTGWWVRSGATRSACRAAHHQSDRHPAPTPHRRSRQEPPSMSMLPCSTHAIPNSTAFMLKC